MSLVIEIDRKYGGFYVHRSDTSMRVCLGYVAFTYHPFSIYDRLRAVNSNEEIEQ